MDSCNGVFLVTKRYELVDYEICMYNLKSASRYESGGSSSFLGTIFSHPYPVRSAKLSLLLADQLKGSR